MNLYQFVQRQIQDLRIALEDAVKIPNKVASSQDELDYRLSLKILNVHINSFRESMLVAADHYIEMRKAGSFKEQSLAQHTKNELEKLQQAHKKAIAAIPKQVLKSSLGSNYDFFSSIPKLKPDVFLKFFKVNYDLRK